MESTQAPVSNISNPEYYEGAMLTPMTEMNEGSEEHFQQTVRQIRRTYPASGRGAYLRPHLEVRFMYVVDIRKEVANSSKCSRQGSPFMAGMWNSRGQQHTHAIRSPHPRTLLVLLRVSEDRTGQGTDRLEIAFFFNSSYLAAGSSECTQNYVISLIFDLGKEREGK